MSDDHENDHTQHDLDDSTLGAGLDTEQMGGATETTLPSTDFDPAQFDPSQWSDDQLPTDWTTWQEPTNVDPASYDPECDCSPQWGEVQPQWSEQGQDPFPGQEPEVPLSEDLTAGPGQIGPGHLYDVDWQYQGQTQTCAVYSVRSILSELYGQQVDVQDVFQRAVDNGWISPDGQSGMTVPDIEKLINSYGVSTHELDGKGGAWSHLNTALANNQRVVVTVDGGEMRGDDPTHPDEGRQDFQADHAVAITGIDYARGVVIVNDSAPESGAGEEIPIKKFFDAWHDSNWTMIVTDQSAPAPSDGGAAPPSGTDGLLAGAPEYTMLPINFTPRPAQA